MTCDAIDAFTSGTPVLPQSCEQVRGASGSDIVLFAAIGKESAVLASSRDSSLPLARVSDVAVVDAVVEAIGARRLPGGDGIAGVPPRWCRSGTASPLRWVMWLPLQAAHPASVVTIVGGRSAAPAPAQCEVLMGARRVLQVVANLAALHHPEATTARDAGPPGQPGQPAVTLSEREHDVLGLLAEGLTARLISTRLGVSPRTVHRHLGNMYRKLDAHDRLTAVNHARSEGLIDDRSWMPAHPPASSG